MPKGSHITPTTNFIVFSGTLDTRANGYPDNGDNGDAVRAGKCRERDFPWFAPNVSRDEATSRPSSSTPFNDV